MRARSVSLLVVCLLAAGCAGTNPLSPSSSNNSKYGDLTVRLDAACAGVRIGSADVFIDGEYQAALRAGGSTTRTVTVGSHFVEASAYYVTSGQRAYTWGPSAITVPAAGFTYLFYC